MLRSRVPLPSRRIVSDTGLLTSVDVKKHRETSLSLRGKASPTLQRNCRLGRAANDENVEPSSRVTAPDLNGRHSISVAMSMGSSEVSSASSFDGYVSCSTSPKLGHSSGERSRRRLNECTNILIAVSRTPLIRAPVPSALPLVNHTFHKHLTGLSNSSNAPEKILKSKNASLRERNTSQVDLQVTASLSGSTDQRLDESKADCESQQLQNSVKARFSVSNRIRASLAPSFIDRVRHESPAPIVAVATTSFKPGHRRVPTALRSVPSIHLHESEDEVECSESSITGSRPPSPKVVAQGRELPVWIPDSAADRLEGTESDEEPTLTIHTVSINSRNDVVHPKAIASVVSSNDDADVSDGTSAAAVLLAPARSSKNDETPQLKHKRSRSVLSNMLSLRTSSRSPSLTSSTSQNECESAESLLKNCDKKKGGSMIRRAVNRLRM